jgi:hypothetical protein
VNYFVSLCRRSLCFYKKQAHRSVENLCKLVIAELIKYSFQSHIRMISNELMNSKCDVPTKNPQFLEFIISDEVMNNLVL